MRSDPAQDTAQEAKIKAIHDIASAELAQRSENFDVFSHTNALDAVAQSPRGLIELEARIMLQLAGRIRPARTRIFLNTLRKLRVEEGNPEAFDAFEALLKERLGTQIIVGHDFGVAGFAAQDHQPIWVQTRDLIARLSGHVSGVFLNSGTLLGVVRDGKLIDHDDDIDLAVLIEAKDERDAGRKWAQMRASLVSLAGGEDLSSPRAPQITLGLPGGLKVDLFPAWVSGAGAYVYPHTYGELEEGDVLPLATCDVTGLPIPARPEKMLAVNYGAD
ncbi:LicD family protein [Roseovarius dicentrarchi]|uniref:LicD family protein n=1 Tax=Roseovarius dicentrarchi TaxID=2250573 RepID=UPI000DE8586C|nr:LicD family protein [Roseovarius dicentrarchi]